MYNRLPGPSNLTGRLVFGFMSLHKYLQYQLASPRFGPFHRARINAKHSPKTGRCNLTEYISFPCYIQPVVYDLWGSVASLCWAVGAKLPGGDDFKFSSQGVSTLEVGPKTLEGKEYLITRRMLNKLDCCLVGATTPSFHFRGKI